MSRIWSFQGGIHPPENKQQSLQQPLQPLSLPERLILPLQQNIGTPAVPRVNVGEKVLKGQCIADPGSHVSVFHHAPTSGTVSDIGMYPVPHASGMDALCIVIEPDGEERWAELEGIEDFRAASKKDVAEKIRVAGLAGMGGAGFPTDIKLHLSDDHIVTTLIANGVECEPYITADDTLMRARAEEVIGGLEIATHLIQPTHVLIGIEDNKPEAAMAINAAAARSPLDIEVVVVPTKYPSGGERQLIKLLTGVEVPHGQIPADIGIVVQNVGTLAAVYRAVHAGEPLISRITTLTGDAAERPGNYEVLLGTPVSHLLDEAGVDRERLSRLIMGGPMMGYTLDQPGVPLIKTSNCLIAGTQEEFPPAPPAQNCIRCGQCEQVCPASLLPQQLHWFAKGREFGKALDYNLMDCIECGACAYVCPSNIPLVQYYRFAKGEIRKEQVEQRKAEQARQRFEARQARLEQEKEEKARKRRERAEAAARAQTSRPQPAATNAGAQASDPEAQLKQLKTQAAVARTKLKKAQKALEQAEATGEGDSQALAAEVAAAQARSDALEKQLQQAQQQAQADPSKEPDLKALKVAAAVARTKVSKTEKALTEAEQKGAPSAEKLRDSLATLRAKADEAQRAFEEAERAAASGQEEDTASPALDIKALKTAAAVARTKLKKAQRALSDARETGDTEQIAEFEPQVRELEAQAEKAARALAEAEAAQPASPVEADLKALKSAAAIARTKVKKTEKALADAREKGLASADQLETALAGLRQKAADAERALQDAQPRAGAVEDA
ncbi:electron transport complex subunit RsxC [Motiliproteus sp. SC1-56]|uniref:electron transport complex subunit RsxC n=1 Tax=Motiliproteus sp. SC1-56 TaxID=2799565 RepID=UPI001A8DB80B|nr:electron transport complex subunit RsxC [Motiliproteus sp. SC1-56]